MLAGREKEVLIAVVKEYIKNPRTVSSRTIAKKYDFHLSSATIRNVMADLEEMGFLYQPHTSAGRIPTLRGFKVYIESVLDELARYDRAKVKEVEEIKEKLESLFADKREMFTILRVLPRFLAEYTKYAGLAYSEILNTLKIEKIEFVTIDPTKLLVVIVFEGEYIYTKIVHLQERVEEKRIERINDYLNHKAVGLTLFQLIHTIFKDMKDDEAKYLNHLKAILKNELANLRESGNIIIEKTPDFFEHPEFSDVERIKNIMRAFEDKELIVRVLKNLVKTGTGVEVIMGEDTEINEFKDMSFVVAFSGKSPAQEVIVGIAGPVRMEYERVIPVVEEVSEFLKGQFGAE